MTRMMFVNLPVTDLAASRRFLEAIGATNEPKFTDDTAACMRFSDSIFVMILTHAKYRDFTDLPIGDPRTSSQMSVCLSCDSRAAVDEVVARGAAAGGGADPSPVQDYGFMYGRGVTDPDGFVFDFMWMDPVAAEAGPAAMALADGSVPLPA